MNSEPVVAPDRFPVKVWLIAFAGWMFDFYDLILFSFLLVPMGNDLGLTPHQEEVLLGVALGGSGLGGIVFGWLSDLYGRKRVMTWTILLYSVGSAGTAFVQGAGALLLCRAIVGLGVGGEWAVGHALLAEWTPGRMRGRASALLQSGEPTGVALAAVMGLLVAPAIGWRAVFLISSVSAGMALVVRSHMPESRLWEQQREERLSPVAALRLIARRGLVGPMFKGWLLGVFKLGTYWTCYIWFPKFLTTEMHQPVGRSALWILTAQLGQFLGMLGFGLVSDRWGRRVAYTVYSLLTAASLYPLAFHWRELFALGLGSGCTAGFGALLAELFPTEVRNFAMGTAYNCARGVQFFAPILVSAMVLRWGVAGGLSVPLILALATATWVWTLPETRARDLAAIAE
jgi:MFS family permease